MPLQRRLSPQEAQSLVNAGKTMRARELERLQAYFDGTQYLGRPGYLDQASNVPRLERAPCVVYPLVPSAVESYVALCMGGSRFPRILSMTSEDDTFQGGLSPTDSETIDRFNQNLIDSCNLQAAFAQAYRMSLTQRSVALVMCYRNGLPCADAVPACYCVPTLDRDQCTVMSLEIRYRFIDYFRDQLVTAGEWWPVVKEYRRVIDATYDTTYQVREVWDSTDINPSTLVDIRTAHGFGCCPVVWYARQRKSLTMGGFDGQALADGKLDAIDAINHALSSRHLGAMYCGDPQMFAFGFDAMDLQSGGRALDPMAMSTENPQWDSVLSAKAAQPSSVIRKGPGELLRSENPNAKAGYVTLPSDALLAIDKHAADVAAKVREGMRYVWLDPTNLAGSGDISGKTLAFVFSSQTHAVAQDRSDFGRSCLLSTLAIIYRMLMANPAGVYLRGLKQALPILSQFWVGPVFMAPQFQLKWGDFFEASDTDEATRVATAVSAKTAGLITQKTAIEHIAGPFAIQNVDQYADALAKEKAQAVVDARAAVAAGQVPQISAPPAPPGPAAHAPCATDALIT